MKTLVVSSGKLERLVWRTVLCAAAKLTTVVDDAQGLQLDLLLWWLGHCLRPYAHLLGRCTYLQVCTVRVYVHSIFGQGCSLGCMPLYSCGYIFVSDTVWGRAWDIR